MEWWKTILIGATSTASTVGVGGMKPHLNGKQIGIREATKPTWVLPVAEKHWHFGLPMLLMRNGSEVSGGLVSWWRSAVFNASPASSIHASWTSSWSNSLLDSRSAVSRSDASNIRQRHPDRRLGHHPNFCWSHLLQTDQVFGSIVPPHIAF